MRPREVYEERVARFAAEEALWTARSRALSWTRLGVFVAGLAGLFMFLWRGGAGAWLPSSGAIFAVFVVLIFVHDRVIRRERRVGDLAALNREGLFRLDRRWDELPSIEPLAEPGASVGGEMPPFVRDLQIFGPASLLQLLATAASPPGRWTVTGWLLAGADPVDVRGRQGAVKALAPELGLRQAWTLGARRVAAADPDAEPFLRWTETGPWLAPRPVRRWMSRLLSLVALALLGAAVAGVVPWSAAAASLIVNLVFANYAGAEISEILDRIETRSGRFRLYAELFALLDGLQFNDPLLESIVAETGADGLSAHRQLKILDRWMAFADARHSAPFHFILQALLLWDFHVLTLIEGWQVRVGSRVRRWLTALGRFEALSALAGVAFDHPDWVFPELVEPTEGEEPVLEARGLGHPLIPDPERVANDVEVGPPGSFLLVTGSNMSGKSTLLRSLGINAVLAQAGSPVCARAMRMPPLSLGTSVLVEDSLVDGVSFFMAELLRIRRVVDLARGARSEGRTLFYLLDEVLRGTNSKERRIAVVRVLGHLLESRAIGALSTHDAALAETPELATRFRPVHFREEIHPGPDGKPRMTFDYRLREGVATTTNALRLLELVGLGERDSE